MTKAEQIIQDVDSFSGRSIHSIHTAGQHGTSTEFRNQLAPCREFGPSLQGQQQNLRELRRHLSKRPTATCCPCRAASVSLQQDKRSGVENGA